MSDLLEGDVCWPTRTITRAFTPREPGFLRITGARYQSTIRTLYADGALVNSWIYTNEDVELRAGVRYELRVTGGPDYHPSMLVQMTLQRPVD